MAKKQSVRGRLKSIWKRMILRCFDPTDRNFKKYGGKGILVCEGWLGFDKFYEWALSAEYVPYLSIDRIDPDKGYSPDNCQWIPFRENCNYKRKYKDRPTCTRKLTKSDVLFIHSHPELSPSTLGELLGVNRRTVWNVRSGATWPELHPDLDLNERSTHRPCRKRVTWSRKDYEI